LAALLILKRQIFYEAGNEIALGKQRVDGKIDLQAPMQLKQAGADRARMCAQIGRTQRHQVFEADRNDYAIDRLTRPVFLEQRQKCKPAFLIGRDIGILGRVATGGINENCLSVNHQSQ